MTPADDASWKRGQKVALHLGASFDAAWENVLLPWFEARARAPVSSTPSAVVTPSRSFASLLRGQLLARGISILGLEFLSPAQLREKLLRDRRNLPLREHLRLLLAIAAGKIAAGDEENLVARSIARDPDRFLRAIDQLNAAGWSTQEIIDPGLRAVAQAFEKSVHAGGFEFVHEADRAALHTGADAAFQQLLLFGFSGAHWPLWPLLRTAVGASEQAIVLLNDPRDEARELDETWIGTWEEIFGGTQPIAATESENVSRLETLGRLPESEAEKAARAAQPLETIHFLVGRDTPEQAKAIVALAAQFLQEEKSERIGILFPRSGALPRIVARLLASAKIAHNDGLAHLGPSAFDSDAWRAWLELQQNPRLRILLRFLRATTAKIFAKLPIHEVEDVLRRAYADILIDQIELLRAYCAQQKDSARHAAVLGVLEKIQFLPPEATFSEFLAQTRRIFSDLGWKQHWSEVDRLSRTWAERLPDSFARSRYLRWLREVLSAPSLQRDDYGSHAYARVQLLPYAEAEGQPWSHLIFAGLNEEAWPTLEDEFGFIGEEEIGQFNQRSLNRRALQRGRHGEGQWSVREGKTILLGANERRQIRRRQLTNLLESAALGIGVTANLFSEAAPNRTANPSELFSRLYLSARGAGVSQKTLQALEAQTRAWLRDWSPLDAQKIDSISLGRTRYAYEARRKPGAATEYEFALRTPPDRPISLRVTEWEQTLRWPAII